MARASLHFKTQNAGSASKDSRGREAKGGEIPSEPRLRIRVVGPGEEKPKGVVPWHERIRWPHVERRLATYVERIPPGWLPVLWPQESPEEAKLKRQLKFPVKLMLSAQPPLFSQPVSRDWWVSVYKEGQRPPNLPARAQERWMRACGMNLVAMTLVYHERIKSVRRRDKAMRRVKRFVVYDLPRWREQAQQRLRQISIPSQVLVTGVMVLSGLVALTAFAGVAIAAAAVGAVLHDPVLVIIDRTGRWIEIDRWDD